MEWISNWIQGIIVAVIIGTIIEMILPEGNSKKYIKVVIGVYILFSIISPAINKITGENFNISNILDIDQYVEASSTNTYEDLNQEQDEQIRSIYENSLKNDMKEKIQSKGYEVIEITLGIKNDQEYTLENINLVLQKQVEEEANKVNVEKEVNTVVNNIQTVNEIQIQVGEDQKNSEAQTEQKKENISISTGEQKELKKYLSETYQVEEKNININ